MKRIIGWTGKLGRKMDKLEKQMKAMIGKLDQMREFLEEISTELGLTDPRSGKIVAEWD